MKTAIITGATGQDGSYLTEMLLEKDYNVKCIVRRTSNSLSVSNLKDCLNNKNLEIFTADLLDLTSILKVFETCKDLACFEVYNLAAQSHVGVSFDCPRVTFEVNTIGTLNLLEAVRQLGLIDNCKFYQASTSEMFGKVHETPQTETTPFHPRSPYGVSKMAAHWCVKNYRETYGIFACCGLLFNHESPRRGEHFVTQKIVKSVQQIVDGDLDCLELGNLDAKRDWGHAKDYVEAMWLMLQQETPDDYIVSSGETHSVREFVEIILDHHKIVYKWEGDTVISDNKVIVAVSEKFYRPCEVDVLLGDCAKIKDIGWTPKFTFKEMIVDMTVKTITQY